LPGAFRPSSVPKKILLSRSHQLLELACRVAGAPFGGVGLVSAEGELVEHIPYGLAEQDGAEPGDSSRLAKLVHFVLRQPEPMCLDDLAATHPRLGAPDGLAALGPFLGLPLHCPGRYRGVLYLARGPDQPGFRKSEREMVEPIRTWLEQGSLFEEAHLLAQLRLLNRVAQTAAGNLDLGLILDRSLRELDRHLPLHVSAVWLVDDPDPGQLTLAATSSIPSTRAADLGLEPGLRLALDQTPFAGCLRDGQGLYTDLAAPAQEPAADQPVAAPRPALEDQLAARGATCFFAAPLRAGEQSVGILQSVCTRAAGFTGEQIQLLYLVADLLGPAISSCRLFGRLRSTYEELRTAQEQLIHTEKMRALGELASGMAHDFNNSLCGVQGFLELAMMDKTLSPAGRKFLESARTCAQDAAQTVRRIQDFARCRRKQPEFQAVDVNDLLRQTIELTRHKWDNPQQAQGAPIRVEVLAGATARVSGSPAELREVLTNLVFNAVDAMPQGGTLTLRSRSTADHVFLSVEDTGTGMSPAVRQRLFEPFFTTKGERGTGLGLSVAFGIVQSHGGEISAASEVGQGSTLTIRLPVLREAAGSAERKARSAEGGARSAKEPSAPRSTLRALRILVVEDEQSVRHFLERVLKHLGHHPRLAGDATEGLAAFNAERFDLVFTDYGLPAMSGEELAQAITAQSPATPVVLLTGWSDQFNAEGRPLPGVTRILGKPLAINVLAETLDAVCPRA
jgi:signal transduction histidine kinase